MKRLHIPRMGSVVALIGLAFWLGACQATPPARISQVFNPQKLAEMDDAITEAILERKTPGGVLWLERDGVTYRKTYGNRAVAPEIELMTADTIFDAASLTKVVATAPSIMLLVERGKVQIDAPVRTYIPEFTGEGKENITVRHLMTHTSGLRSGIPRSPAWSGYEKGIELACAEKPLNPPGTMFRYSDINYILLGEVVQRASGVKLNEFAARNIFEPLRMVDTGFVPPAYKRERIAPTEKIENDFLRGTVHDPTSRRMGGVTGHAGLFLTASDLARYARMLLNEGSLDGVRVLRPETVRFMTSVQSPESVPARRGLGWDIDSSYSGPRGKLFPIGSYGHTGWTGTSIWIDPFSRTFLVFLSNRNHPDEKGSVIALRSRLGTLAAASVTGFNFAHVPGALAAQAGQETGAAGAAIAQPPVQVQTLNGIDVLVKQDFAPFRGLKLGLITNHTGQDRERNPTIDLLKNAPGVRLLALFSPEHGIRGALDQKITDSVDEKTGLPIYSLYGETRKPTSEHLQNLDALVFDIQDIGCRYYTYISTMGLAIEAAGENGKKIFVLDRVNPITGAMVDGPVLTEATSFVGFHPIPIRHGMTVGELAKMFNAERNSKADLVVIPVENWRRDLWFDQTGLPWSNPSPNMRNVNQAALYPGVGFLERALSVGRGTDQPFELVGAPYIDDVRFAVELNNAGLPGVRFVPVRFTPTTSVHKDEDCGGVYIFLTDRDRCNVVDIGLHMMQILHRLYPGEFDLDKTKHLVLHGRTLDGLREGKPIKDIRATWQIDLEEFQKRRARFLMYQ